MTEGTSSSAGSLSLTTMSKSVTTMLASGTASITWGMPRDAPEVWDQSPSLEEDERDDWQTRIRAPSRRR
jgi:hypothetical protein